MDGTDARGAVICVGVLDNDPYALKMLESMIVRLDPSFAIAWVTELGAVAISRCLSPAKRPDVLVTDMSLRDVPGTEVCRAIRTKTPRVGLVGITSYALDAFRDEAARCGAQALVGKTDLAGLALAIRGAAAGLASGTAFMDAVDAHVLLEDAALAAGGTGARTGVGALSAKERETLRRYADGETTKEIAAAMGVGVPTVATFERRALAKLGARSRAHAISICVRRHEF
ncbi:response regulator transcription factor [Bifidobacterium avesanii]|uniref:Response regulator n=1 Tax=Bifidobacterium avesanii TaxID=1798157 RepID=A0A7K3TLN2_9BIFI|nr:response regulator transcription factor [Bifidobacterium avesanii]NEG79173.1 response regulator [Bifidobacterium avesanii]